MASMGRHSAYLYSSMIYFFIRRALNVDNTDHLCQADDYYLKDGHYRDQEPCVNNLENTVAMVVERYMDYRQ
jgi:hypothetical protein